MFDVITFDAIRALKDALLAKLSTTAKPLRITEYTNGVGVHNFHPESTHQYVTLVGGGGKGGNAYNTGGYSTPGAPGNGGEQLQLRVSMSGQVSYEVGAPNGGMSTLGNLYASGGYQGGNGGSTNQGQVTPAQQRIDHGVTSSRQATGMKGGDSNMGKGGKNGANGVLPEPGGGYGAGGGGGFPANSQIMGANGSGGYIRIEEY